MGKESPHLRTGRTQADPISHGTSASGVAGVDGPDVHSRTAQNPPPGAKPTAKAALVAPLPPTKTPVFMILTDNYFQVIRILGRSFFLQSSGG
jgi:hypothetical protein